ncbi:hypothetical protein [Candidatus Ichthyocystis hellenicum]|uniref:hypothetical protein n=1 Tax=Candidatus Ichthyocystis hellenicum TaxID=1561003 RepID=UPI000B8035E3|nr:hypothetical protein [Candidatus Ichthyocystis hellenicum]
MRSIFAMCFGNNGDDVDVDDGVSSDRLSVHSFSGLSIADPSVLSDLSIGGPSVISNLSIGGPPVLSNLSIVSPYTSGGEYYPPLPLVSFLSGSLTNLSFTSCYGGSNTSLSSSVADSGSISFEFTSFLARIPFPRTSSTPLPSFPPFPSPSSSSSSSSTLANIFALCCCNCNRSDS